MVPIIKQTANKSNYGGSRNVSKIKYIVIHYTGNDGDKALNNAKHFKNNIVKASAHYFVDDTTIYQSVPDDYVAYAVGGKKYNNGGGRLYGTVTNTNSISIELCDTYKNGIVYPTKQTIQNAIELTNLLMKKYNIPIHRVIRHYDVNGKLCPSYWVNQNLWVQDFYGKLSGVKVPTSEQDKNPYVEPTGIITSKQNAREQGISNFNYSGNGVRWVQWELEHVNETFRVALENAGGIDGQCGSTTVGLIKLFQSMYGLDPDGLVGKNTRNALKAN